MIGRVACFLVTLLGVTASLSTPTRAQPQTADLRVFVNVDVRLYVDDGFLGRIPATGDEAYVIPDLMVGEHVIRAEPYGEWGSPVEQTVDVQVGRINSVSITIQRISTTGNVELLIENDFPGSRWLLDRRIRNVRGPQRRRDEDCEEDYNGVTYRVFRELDSRSSSYRYHAMVTNQYNHRVVWTSVLQRFVDSSARLQADSWECQYNTENTVTEDGRTWLYCEERDMPPGEYTLETKVDFSTSAHDDHCYIRPDDIVPGFSRETAFSVIAGKTTRVRIRFDSFGNHEHNVTVE